MDRPVSSCTARLLLNPAGQSVSQPASDPPADCGFSTQPVRKNLRQRCSIFVFPHSLPLGWLARCCFPRVRLDVILAPHCRRVFFPTSCPCPSFHSALKLPVPPTPLPLFSSHPSCQPICQFSTLSFLHPTSQLRFITKQSNEPLSASSAFLLRPEPPCFLLFFFSE